MNAIPANTTTTEIPVRMSSDGAWYAVHTRARHEKAVAAQLAQRNIPAFLPTAREIRSWSDRKQIVDMPLFSCYVFMQVRSWQTVHRDVLGVRGVIGWVGTQGGPSEIAEQEVEAVRSMVKTGMASVYPFLKVGQRVRVRGGCLDGVEGVLVCKNGEDRLVVSIELIQQAVAVSLKGYEVVAA